MASTIPVIDIYNPALSKDKIAHDLVNAAAEHGFIYIRNTGLDIPASDIEAAFELSRTLFGSPLEEKQKCTIQKNNRGWSGMHSETLDPKNQRVGDYKEAFNFGPFPNSVPTQPLPTSIQHLAPQIASFRTKCHTLCLHLLSLFGTGLSLTPPSFFADSHDPTKESGTILRHLYYPALTSSSTTEAENNNADDVRAGAHSDYGSITLLFRLAGQPGLQVLLPNNCESSSSTVAGDTNSTTTIINNNNNNNWVAVPVIPDGTQDDPAPPILVNIGDLLSYWTGGLLRSTVHRVVFPSLSPSPFATDKTGASGVPSSANIAPAGQGAAQETDLTGDRYSIAFFCHPAGETELLPVPSERVRQHVEARRAEMVKGAAGLLDPELGNPYAERKVMTADEHLLMRLRASYLTLYQK